MNQEFKPIVTATAARHSTLLIVLSSIGFGLIPIFAKQLAALGLASPAVAFFRYGVTLVALLPFLTFSPEKRQATGFAIGSGVVMGIGWIGYLEALNVAPVSTVGVIYMSYPLFALLFAWVLIGQRPTFYSVVAGVLIIGAAALAFSPDSLGAEAIRALLFSFAAPATFGFGVAVLAEKLWVLSPLERMSGVSLGGGIGLIPMMANQEWSALIPSSWEGWGWALSMVFCGALLPQLLYVVAAPNVGSGRAAVAGSIELPTMFVIGWLAFGESIGLYQLIAGLMVMLAIPLVPPIRADRNVSSVAPPD